MKKILLASILCGMLYADTKTENPYNLSYDSPNGWWWYEEKVTDPKTKAETIVKEKLTTKEKMAFDKDKEQLKLLKELISEQKKNNELQAKIVDRLEYAFPDVTPRMTVNKKTGEPCVTNSSMDCFIMPVIAEGQQVPALKEFIRNPSPANSKNWLQWQATYFNHVQKVSHGLRFAYLQGGDDTYPTATSFARGDSVTASQAETAAAHRQAKILDSLKDSVALLVFVGKNEIFEKTNKIETEVHNWNSSYLKNIDKVFIFDSKLNADKFLQYVKHKTDKSGDKQTAEFWKTAKILIKPEMYKQYNVVMTPSVVMYYEDKKTKKNISQLIVSGTLSSDYIRSQATNFLTYNGIVDEKEYSADKNWESPEIGYEMKKPEIKNDKIFEDYTTGGNKK